MNLPIIQRFIAKFKVWSLVSVSALGLIGCGGGGSGGSDGVVIAPESLDQVKMSFFGAFTMECYRLNGTAGQEHGAVQYDRLKSTFPYTISSGGEGLGYVLSLPSILTNVQYDYERTGADTGRVTFTFTNDETYPHPEATATVPEVYNATGDMFWGGRNDLAVNLVVDILFTEQAGVIANTTTRIRSGYIYRSVWDGLAANNTATPFDFDTVDVSYSLLTGGRVPSGYNPYVTITPETPSSAVWTSIQGRSVEFAESELVYRRIAHQAVGASGPPIPGEINIEEYGTILVDENDGINVTQGVGGSYSYVRTGGSKAKMAIRYQKTVGGIPQTVNVVYDMDFEALDSGTYLDSKGAQGNFLENLYAPN